LQLLLPRLRVAGLRPQFTSVEQAPSCATNPEAVAVHKARLVGQQVALGRDDASSQISSDRCSCVAVCSTQLSILLLKCVAVGQVRHLGSAACCCCTSRMLQSVVELARDSSGGWLIQFIGPETGVSQGPVARQAEPQGKTRTQVAGRWLEAAGRPMSRQCHTGSLLSRLALC
jgi:hypothetical protein